MKLQDWVLAKHEGRPLPAKACAITFDDGWLDNYEYAWPLLNKHQVPATVFVVSEQLGTDFVFWPNAVARLLVSGAHEALKNTYPFSKVYASHYPDGYFHAPTREAIALWIHHLKHFSDAEIYHALNQMPKGLWAVSKKPALMDWSHLKTMIDSGWVDVGAHTCNHFRLNSHLNAHVMRHEITACRTQIEAQLQVQAPLFCYPNGDFTPEAQALVQQSYQAAVTTRYGIVQPSDDLYALPRMGLHEDASASSVAFAARLSGRC